MGNGGASDLNFVNLLTKGSKLKTLSLVENGFEGVMPHSIASLSTTATIIAMGGNQISGTITLGIKKLIFLNLYALTMVKNKLSGPIPHVIGGLKNLQILYLAGNILQDSILPHL